MQDIKDFRIGKAFYILENNKGSRIRLTLDYTEDYFRTEPIVKGGNFEKLIGQAGIIAKDMLSRKAKKNLSFKLLKLKL